ncbi:MAG: hypothetical protein AB1671_03915 [Thermodesulfobacteriota bacterium]|jgi:hypothetical protein
MGEAYWRLDDLDTAERCCRQDLELSIQADRARPERRDEMRAKNYLANVCFARGAVAEAETLYAETEAYYRARFDAGNTNEFGNLVYSVEGLARTAAAREEWDQVARLEERHAELAQRLLKPDEPAILPVALLRYLHALKWQRENRPVDALARLVEAEHLLGQLYPAERAMVVIAGVISELSLAPPANAQAIQASMQKLEKAATSLWSILDVGEKREVVRCFAPIRRDVEHGRGALAERGQDLLARDRRRRENLAGQFAAARSRLAAGSAGCCRNRRLH